MNYNCAHFGGDAGAIQSVIVAAHSDNKTGWAKPVDILLFQEVTSATVGTLQTAVNSAAPVGTTYARATFTTSSGEDASAGAQCAFYRVQTVSETASAHVDIFTGAGRNADRWLFKLNGYSSSAASLYVYSAHLKASLGFEDDRETGALAIRLNANSIGAGVRAIYVGDFNIYVNTESAYLAFLAAGNGRGNDALGTGSWSGSSNAWKHTQSPRLASGALVGGGMDDRFDFHLMTDQLSDGEGLSVIASTYRSLGNDGNHYNIAINTGANTYYPLERSRSNALASALFNASDHIPVLVDYQVPAVMAATIGAIAPRVIQGANLTATVAVQNVVVVATNIGSDELDYTVSGVAGLIGGASSGIAPLAPAVANAVFSVNTGTIGVLEVEAQVTSSSEAVQNGAIVLPTSCVVLSRAKPSWQSTSLVTSITVPLSIATGSSPVNFDVPLHNYGWQSLQSKLDADFISFPAGSALSRVGGLPMSVAGTPGLLHLRLNPVGLPIGLTTINATLLTSDEDIPGEGDGSLSLSIAVTVGDQSQPGDINGDGVVDATDLAILLAQWGGPGSADIDHSGVVDGNDLATLLGNWG